MLPTTKKERIKINKSHIKNGVTIIDIENTYICSKSKIGKDTIIYPGNIIENSDVGCGCKLYQNNRINNSTIGDNNTIESTTIDSAEVENNNKIGPNAYIRPNSKICNDTKIGDFVEIKNSKIGNGTKISHLTYVGDSDLGKNINLGCGVVFVNYDGFTKHRSVVEDGAFIGCNVNLVSPVRVGKNAYVAAGSTITEDIQSGSLAIARSRQVEKTGWVEKFRELKQKRER